MIDTNALNLRFSIFGLIAFMTMVSVMIFWLSRPRRFEVTAYFTRINPSSTNTVKTNEGGDSQIDVSLAFNNSTLWRKVIADRQINKLSLIKSHSDAVGWLCSRLRPAFANESKSICGVSLIVKESECKDAEQILLRFVCEYESISAANGQDRESADISKLIGQVDAMGEVLDDEIIRLSSIGVDDYANNDEVKRVKERVDKCKKELLDLGSKVTENNGKVQIANQDSSVAGLVSTTYLGRW